MRIFNLSNKSGSLTSSDKFVLDNGTNVMKIDYNALAKAIIEQYTGSTLAGSAQSVKAALDALNSNIEGTLSSSHTLASGLCYLVKVGKVVTATMRITTTSAVSSYGTLATLPNGFRPYAQMWGKSPSCEFDITQGGLIRTMNSLASGAVVDISATFVTR